ncbi:MAG: hypothetical protein AMJ53_16840 [Gammaproteobacteria bacterium SG8_11]|nr:MAG: hypothetical protein AMJ53_16840 [Gammaproteobacteria bacterium SG8_11]
MIDTLQSPYVHAGTTENFQSLVLDNSTTGPVLVNFWSRKAGPCLRQYPILDKLVHQYTGCLLLVNIDTEKEFVFTKQYGIASVPTLKLFRFGKVVETRHGYQSEEDLKKLLDLYVVRDSDKELAKAMQFYTKGHTSEAYQTVVDAIVSDPINPRLPLAMCKLLKHEERFDEAIKLLESLPANIRKHSEFEQLYAQLEFQVDALDAGDLNQLIAHTEAVPDDLPTKRQLAAFYVVHQQYEPALQVLLNMMQVDHSYADHYAQKAMQKIFTFLGSDHELVAKYRSNLIRFKH